MTSSIDSPVYELQSRDIESLILIISNTTKKIFTYIGRIKNSGNNTHISATGNPAGCQPASM
jgi:hypothetical protein